MEGSDDPTESSARARVLQHLRRLLTSSALAGITLSGCGRSEPPVVCDPLPPPHEQQTVPPEPREDVPPGSQDDQDQDQDRNQDQDQDQGTPPGPPPVVCDPLPPPDLGED